MDQGVFVDELDWSGVKVEKPDDFFTGPEIDQLYRILESAWIRADQFGIPAAELRHLAGKVRRLQGGSYAGKN